MVRIGLEPAPEWVVVSGASGNLFAAISRGTIVEANTDLAIIEDDECDLVDVQNERAGYVLELLFEEGDGWACMCL